MVKGDLAEQAGVEKRVNVFVHGGERNGGDLPLHPRVNLLGRRMPAQLQHGTEDGLALMGQRQARRPAPLPELREPIYD